MEGQYKQGLKYVKVEGNQLTSQYSFFNYCLNESGLSKNNKPKRWDERRRVSSLFHEQNTDSDEKGCKRNIRNCWLYKVSNHMSTFSKLSPTPLLPTRQQGSHFALAREHWNAQLLLIIYCWLSNSNESASTTYICMYECPLWYLLISFITRFAGEKLFNRLPFYPTLVGATTG